MNRHQLDVINTRHFNFPCLIAFVLEAKVVYLIRWGVDSDELEFKENFPIVICSSTFSSLRPKDDNYSSIVVMMFFELFERTRLDLINLLKFPVLDYLLNTSRANCGIFKQIAIEDSRVSGKILEKLFLCFFRYHQHVSRHRTALTRARDRQEVRETKWKIEI